VAVARRGASYVLLSNSEVGTSGVGNHKHNDQLAVEWVVGQQPLLVDGGSYIYTANPDARNRFRSVATHNTVSIDSQEQHTLRADWLFRLMQEGTASLEVKRASDGGLGIQGLHTAYCRLPAPVTHTRRVWIAPDGALVLDDLFDGAPSHELRWHLLLYPGVQAHVTGSQITLVGPHGGGVIRSDAAQHWTLEDGWYSPGYGVRIETLALVAQRTDAPRRVTTLLLPDNVSGNRDLHAAQQLADRFWNGPALLHPLAA
jgi:hypothetical protein